MQLRQGGYPRTPGWEQFAITALDGPEARERRAAVAEPHHAYQASVASVDDLVHQLIHALDETGFNQNTSVIFTSESCALDILGAEYVRDFEPGELVVVDERGIRSRKVFEDVRPAKCIFEFIYFSYRI